MNLSIRDLIRKAKSTNESTATRLQKTSLINREDASSRELNDYMNKPLNNVIVSSRILDQHRLNTNINSIYYIPNYINDDLHAQLIEQIESAPDSLWTNVKGRSLICHGGVSDDSAVFPAPPLPRYLHSLTEIIKESIPYFDDQFPQHVLINRYRCGEGIMAHRDGPAYYPCVAILSLSSTATMDFYLKAPTVTDVPAFSILLWPRSLIVFTEDLYQLYHHSISAVENDVITASVINLSQVNSSLNIDEKSVLINQSLKRGTRYSLTVRAAKFHTQTS